MAAWQNTAPDVREAMMQQFVQTVQNSPPLEQEPAASHPGESPPRNYIETLRDLAAALAKRCHVRILIDPALLVPVRPVLPPGTETPAQALEQYAGGGGENSAQSMRLPIMALLMGVWFPRKAKEAH